MTESYVYSDGQDDHPHVTEQQDQPLRFYGTRLPLVLVEDLVYDDVEFEDTMLWGHREMTGEYWPDAMTVPASSYGTVD